METPDIGSAFNSGNDSGITSDQDRPDTGPPNPLPQQPVYYCVQAPNFVHGSGIGPPYAYQPVGPNMMLPIFRPRTIPDMSGDVNTCPVSMPVNMTPCFRNGAPAPHFPMNYGEMRFPAFGMEPNYQFTYPYHDHGPPAAVNQTSEPDLRLVSSPRSGHESPDHLKERQQRDTILSPALTDCVAIVKDESGSSVATCSIGGDSEANNGFRGKKRNGGKKRNDGWMNKQCTFCEMTGKPAQVYQGHLSKNHKNEVICPALMQIVCPCCFKTGKNAHTLQECEVFMTQMKNMMISVVRDVMESKDAT